MTEPVLPSSDPRDVPVVILCGGMGTRLREASERLPKPLVDIGGRPILWHIMKLYSHYGFTRFILCLGYKSDMVKQYFLDYRVHAADFTLQLAGDHELTFHNSSAQEDWTITFVETGLTTGTGGRIKRVLPYIDADRFMLTYGDGIGDVDVAEGLRRHVASGKLGTVTGVHPGSRYGEMHVNPDATEIVEFNEKPTSADGWVSGGFFTFERAFAEKYLTDDVDLFLEKGPLGALARDGQLGMRPHEGFWMGMDTYRDWVELNERWDSGNAPWKLW